MIIGYPPFYADSPAETCRKIINWRKHLSFPSSINISNESIDLIKRLITDVDKRLGYNGAEEIKAHPFFKGIDWKNIRKVRPPFIPKLSSQYDNQYFDKFEEEDPFYPNEKEVKNYKKDVCFVDFTYKKEGKENMNMENAIEIINEVKQNLKNDFLNCCSNDENEKEKKLKNNSSKDVDRQLSSIVNNTPKGSSKLLPKASNELNHISNVLTNKTLFSNYNNILIKSNTPSSHSQNKQILENKENINVNINTNTSLKPLPIPKISSLKNTTSSLLSSDKELRNFRTPNILESKVNLIKTLTANSVSSSKNSSRLETKGNENPQSSASNYQIKIKVPMQTSIKVSNQKTNVSSKLSLPKPINNNISSKHIVNMITMKSKNNQFVQFKSCPGSSSNTPKKYVNVGGSSGRSSISTKRDSN